MHVVLIALLVSTLTTTGLIALWAANSHRHWFLRAAVFLAALAPLLLVPAYEPFLALALEGATIAGGVQLLRRRERRRATLASRAVSPPAPDAAKRRLPRFRLATVLQAMVVIGIAAAITARCPALNREGWQSIVAGGIGGGIAVLLGWFAATRNGWRKAAGLAAACVGALAIAFVVRQFDWFALMLIGGDGWPPSAANYTPSSFASDAYGAVAFIDWLWNFNVAWLLTLPIVVAIVALAVAAINLPAGRGRAVGVAARVGAVLVLAVVMTPAVATLYGMLTPEPIPAIVLPVPNARDEFVAAGEMTRGTLPNSGSYDETTAGHGEVAKAAAQVLPAVTRFRQALNHHSQVPIDYHSSDLLNLNAIQQLRSLGRALSSTGKLAELEGNFDEALSAYVDTIRLGSSGRRSKTSG
jgi:hypothetical protein